jgi:SagB-type dehydrogenase family enzyme
MAGIGARIEYMNTIGKEFIEKTKYKYLDTSDQMKGYESPPLEADYDTSLPHVALPDPRTYKEFRVSIREAIERRTSVRDYSHLPMSREELSYVLWCTQGVREIVSGASTLRTVPSAGARHPLETYLLVNNVKDITPGLYRYRALEHKLVHLPTAPGLTSRITRAFLDQEIVRECAVLFIWVATVYRTTWRYSERGYRYIFLDAGHACQNLYLSAESVGCGVCAIAAFHDDAVNQLLGVDGDKQFAIYAATAGKK